MATRHICTLARVNELLIRLGKCSDLRRFQREHYAVNGDYGEGANGTSTLSFAPR